MRLRNPAKILAVITLAFLAILLIDSLDLDYGLAGMNGPGIRDGLEERFPEGDLEVDLLRNCTICDESGCRTYQGPCWMVNVIEGGEGGPTLVQMVMDAGGGVLEESSGPCTVWWCFAESCRRTYSEQVDDMVYQYTNRDCPGPGNMTCDPVHERCRDCQQGEDCVSSITAASPSGTAYRFEVTRTGEQAVIQGDELVCRIYSRGNLIFQEPMSVEECGDMIYGNTQCQDSECDFVPEFDLLPI